MDLSMAFIIVGGLLEPVWVISLKKFDESRKPLWLIATVFFCVLSPALMGMGMESVPMGVAYAIWTGIGAVCTMIVGYILYGDRINAIKRSCVGLILAGVIGLQLFSGASA